MVTVLQKPKVETQPPDAKKSRGKSLVFVGAGVLLLLFAVVGIAGIFAFNWFKTTPTDKPTNETAKAKVAEGTKVVPSGPTEFGQYWLEVLPDELITEPVRVSGNAPLKSGQAFKFHFELQDDGYLYIVGPGEGNKTTAFLTAKPAAKSGLSSNRVSKGSDFSFPDGIEKWLELDKKPGTENYSIIFSKTPLTAPSFLSAQATGKPLSETERTELSMFLAQHQTNPITEVNNKDTSAPFVSVKVPQPVENEPVIFSVRIQHE